MKKFLILLLLLGGCTAVPVKRNFPAVPDELKTTCPNLDRVNQDARLSDILSTVSKNYGSYHECRIKNEAWIQWYDNQKKIFDAVK